MPLEGILSVGIPVGVFAAVASNRVSVDATMFPGMLLLILIGAVEPALAGFAHPAVISIGALFVFAAGIRETGATQAAAPIQLGRPRSIVAAQFRQMAPVTLLSAFINNTPVVAMYLPLARSWVERIGVSPSKLLLPLSYRSMLGGQLTLIGGASNLIVMGLYVEYLREAGLPALSYGMRFWGPAFVRLPPLSASPTWSSLRPSCSRLACPPVTICGRPARIPSSWMSFPDPRWPEPPSNPQAYTTSPACSFSRSSAGVR